MEWLRTMDPKLAKILIFGLALLAAVLTKQGEMVKELTDLVAGMLIGGGVGAVMYRRPGDFGPSKHKDPPVALTVLLLVLSGQSLYACAWYQKNPVNWPKLVECAPTVQDIVGIVSRVLMSDGDRREMGGRARDELEQLARDHGADTVACLVERLVRDWSSAGSSHSPELVMAAHRGRAFLAEVGTTVELP